MWSAIIQAIDHAMDRMNKGFGAGIEVAKSQNGATTEEQPTTEQSNDMDIIKKPTDENKDDTILSDKDTKDSKAAGEAAKKAKWHTAKNYTTNLSKSFANAAAIATKQDKPYELETSDVDFSLDENGEKNV